MAKYEMSIRHRYMTSVSIAATPEYTHVLSISDISDMSNRFIPVHDA
jgi:hypothetical protein